MQRNRNETNSAGPAGYLLRWTSPSRSNRRGVEAATNRAIVYGGGGMLPNGEPCAQRNGNRSGGLCRRAQKMPTRCVQSDTCRCSASCPAASSRTSSTGNTRRASPAAHGGRSSRSSFASTSTSTLAPKRRSSAANRSIQARQPGAGQDCRGDPAAGCDQQSRGAAQVRSAHVRGSGLDQQTRPPVRRTRRSATSTSGCRAMAAEPASSASPTAALARVPIYNLVPPRGQLADFAFNAAGWCRATSTRCSTPRTTTRSRR